MRSPVFLLFSTATENSKLKGLSFKVWFFFERFWFQYTKTQNVNIFFRLLGQEIVEFLLRKCHLAIKTNWRLCCKLKRAMTMISISRLPPWQKRVAKKRGEDGLLTQEFENGKKNTVNQQDGKKTDQADWHFLDHLSYLNKSKYLQPF